MNNVAKIEVDVKTQRMTDVPDHGPHRQEGDERLREVFEHMWSRLNEVHFMVEALSLHKPGSSGYIQTLEGIKQVSNVDAAYGHMQRLLGPRHR